MKLRIASAVLFWCGVSALATVGQEKTLTKAEFEAVRVKGYSFLEKNAHRVNYAFKSHKTLSNPIERGSSQIVEFQPPDRQRAVTILETKSGPVRFESIEIGARKFTRSGTGQWTEGKASDNRYTIKSETVTLSESYRTLGPEKMSGLNVLIYESALSNEHRSDLGAVLRRSVETYWIDASGRFVKRMVKEMENGELTSSTVAEYDYASKIEIAAPIE